MGSFSAIFAFSSLAWPDVEVESREYHAIIKADLFGSGESRVDNKVGILPTAAVGDILRILGEHVRGIAGSVGATASGSFQLKDGMPRTVEYYDTPGECRLKAHDWIFRVRRKNGMEASDGTLKSRSEDRYNATFRRSDMDQWCDECQDLGGKFEEDLNLFWLPKFSYGHSCEISSSTRLQQGIPKLQDIAHLWPNMETVFDEQGWDLETSLAKVGDLSIAECVYHGLEVHFNNGGTPEVWKLFIKLWFASQSTTATATLAELSFKLKICWNEVRRLEQSRLGKDAQVSCPPIFAKHGKKFLTNFSPPPPV